MSLTRLKLGHTLILGEDEELVENPNPKGRKKMVTKPYADQWLTKQGKPPKYETEKEDRPSKKKEDDSDSKKKDNKTARDKLAEEGSPTDFTGPSSDSDSLSGDADYDKKVVSKLSKLAGMAQEAKKAGKAAPEYNLCEVSVPGTNLFCEGNKGIPREEMPQLKGKPTPGSKADKLPKSGEGEVDGEGLFKQALKDKGVEMKPKTVSAASLKATQSELVGAKVAGMLEALKKDPNHKAITAPIYVSKDGYILDGHHRWAAMVGLDMADGKKEPINMNVVEVDMDAKDLVDFTNDFANEIGIAQKKASTQEEKIKATLNSLILGQSAVVKACCTCSGGCRI